ncbi:unnamed protein product [Peniophora sp. CBMAI 1063]|nr:unnamed protein product [Peniophora sp. CBMAI 1063]
MSDTTAASLTTDERNDHNYNYINQTVRALERPRVAAHGYLAFVKASVHLAGNGGDICSKIHRLLGESAREFCFNGNAYDKGCETEAVQSSMPFYLGGVIPHYECVECLEANPRCETNTRHAFLNHGTKKAKDGTVTKLSPKEARLKYVEVFMPHEVANNTTDWMGQLYNGKLTSRPKLLGKRDVAPIASRVEALMQDIIAENPQQVIPGPGERLEPAPPPPTVEVQASVVEEETPAPVAGPSKRKGKRKAQDNAAAAGPKRARRNAASSSSSTLDSTPAIPTPALLDTATLPPSDGSSTLAPPTGHPTPSDSSNLAGTSTNPFLTSQHGFEIPLDLSTDSAILATQEDGAFADLDILPYMSTDDLLYNLDMTNDVSANDFAMSIAGLSGEQAFAVDTMHYGLLAQPVHDEAFLLASDDPFYNGLDAAAQAPMPSLAHGTPESDYLDNYLDYYLDIPVDEETSSRERSASAFSPRSDTSTVVDTNNFSAASSELPANAPESEEIDLFAMSLQKEVDSEDEDEADFWRDLGMSP